MTKEIIAAKTKNDDRNNFIVNTRGCKNTRYNVNQQTIVKILAIEWIVVGISLYYRNLLM